MQNDSLQQVHGNLIGERLLLQAGYLKKVNITVQVIWKGFWS